jgi:hypothetical protein
MASDVHDDREGEVVKKGEDQKTASSPSFGTRKQGMFVIWVK